MNFFVKNRLIFWLLLVLIIINISALLTFFIMFRAEKKELPEAASNNTSRTFQEQLSLTQEQSDTVFYINNNHRRVAEPISVALKEKRSELLAELEKDHPDTVLLDRYADEIGTLQKEMQKASIRHYLELKGVCDPHQCRKLSSFYRQLYGGNEYGMGQGKRMQNRFRHGQRN